MWIICDANHTVQDRASVKANLSRGYGYIGYKEYEVPKGTDVRVGDTYKDGVLTKNAKRRAEVELEGILHAIVSESIRVDKANELGVDFASIKSMYQNDLTKLQTRKAELESIIAGS